MAVNRTTITGIFFFGLATVVSALQAPSFPDVSRVDIGVALACADGHEPEFMGCFTERVSESAADACVAGLSEDLRQCYMDRMSLSVRRDDACYVACNVGCTAAQVAATAACTASGPFFLFCVAAVTIAAEACRLGCEAC